MKRLLRIVFILFALVGVGFTGLFVYVNFFLPKCMFHGSAEATSPDGRHFAVFEQTTCQDTSRSRASVMMGRNSNRSERVVLMEVRGTTDVRLTWSGDQNLIVVLPRTAQVKRYGPYDEWPRVTEQRRSEAGDGN